MRRNRNRLTRSGRRALDALRGRGGPTVILIDVDGCLTDGRLPVTSDGHKLVKFFGPDDHDAIKAAKAAGIEVQLVTDDHSPITRARAQHMNTNLIEAVEPRIDIIRSFDTDRLVYFGDGWNDALPLKTAAVGIAPIDGWPAAVSAADIVTRPGGRRAVAWGIDLVLRKGTP